MMFIFTSRDNFIGKKKKQNNLVTMAVAVKTGTVPAKFLLDSESL